MCKEKYGRKKKISGRGEGEGNVVAGGEIKKNRLLSEGKWEWEKSQCAEGDRALRKKPWVGGGPRRCGFDEGETHTGVATTVVQRTEDPSSSIRQKRRWHSHKTGLSQKKTSRMVTGGTRQGFKPVGQLCRYEQNSGDEFQASRNGNNITNRLGGGQRGNKDGCLENLGQGKPHTGGAW